MGYVKTAASCTGKHRFARWSDAERVASRQRHDGRGAAHVFRCRICGKYHVGNNTEKQRQERIAWRESRRHSDPSEDDLAALADLGARTRHVSDVDRLYTLVYTSPSEPDGPAGDPDDALLPQHSRPDGGLSLHAPSE